MNSSVGVYGTTATLSETRVSCAGLSRQQPVGNGVSGKSLEPDPDQPEEATRMARQTGTELVAPQYPKFAFCWLVKRKQ